MKYYERRVTLTTIAFDGKTIASDSQITIDGSTKVLGSKIVEDKESGDMIWFAGDCEYEGLYTRHIFSGMTTEVHKTLLNLMNGSCECIYLHRQKKEVILRVYIGFSALSINGPIAIGSGKDFARMAMHLGNDAKRAVELTSIFEVNTNNIVEVYDIKTKKRETPPALLNKFSSN